MAEDNLLKWHVVFSWAGEGDRAIPEASLQVHCTTLGCRGQHNYKFKIYGRIREEHRPGRNLRPTGCFICGTMREVPKQLLLQVFDQLDEWAWPQVEADYRAEQDEQLHEHLLAELREWGWNDAESHKLRGSITSNVIHSKADLLRIFREEAEESMPKFIGFFEPSGIYVETAQWKKVMDRVAPYIPPLGAWEDNEARYHRAHWLWNPVWRAIEKRGTLEDRSPAAQQFCKGWRDNSQRRWFRRSGIMTETEAVNWLMWRYANSRHEALYFLYELVRTSAIQYRRSNGKVETMLFHHYGKDGVGMYSLKRLTPRG